MTGRSHAGKVIVIGAGIGGLTAAIGLRQAGAEVSVCERRSGLDELLSGGGFMLWHNAMLALRQLGLDDQVAAVSTEIKFHEFRSDRGSTLARWHIRPETERITAPAIAVRRSALNSLLLEAAGDSVVMDRRFVGFDQDEHGVVAYFDDGSEQAGDVLVGADGMGSAVRKAMRHGHDLPPRYAGYTAWQAIAQLGGEQLVPSGTFFNLWGRNGLRFLYCRLNENEVYWDAITSDRVSTGFDLLRQGRRDVMLQMYRAWPAPIRAIIEATREELILPINLADRPPGRDLSWGFGRVVLVGDAAHPMTPNLSQGAGQAIEDGVVLSRLLSDRRDTRQAIAEYEKSRRPRVDAMTRNAWRIGRLGRIQGAASCQARDLVMRASFNSLAKRGTYRLMMRVEF
jgi:2-polyprenyl-6-methoxyphenol hydroxylase-like FAD-dependent oxidoreductase